jgi:hypothetical protein
VSTNMEIRQLLRPIAEALGFKGEARIDDLAALLSRRLGYSVSRPTVYAWLNGTRTPPPDALTALMDEFDMQPDQRDEARRIVNEYQRARRIQQAANRSNPSGNAEGS